MKLSLESKSRIRRKAMANEIEGCALGYCEYDHNSNTIASSIRCTGCPFWSTLYSTHSDNMNSNSNQHSWGHAGNFNDFRCDCLIKEVSMSNTTGGGAIRRDFLMHNSGADCTGNSVQPARTDLQDRYRKEPKEEIVSRLIWNYNFDDQRWIAEQLMANISADNCKDWHLRRFSSQEDLYLW